MTANHNVLPIAIPLPTLRSATALSKSLTLTSSLTTSRTAHPLSTATAQTSCLSFGAEQDAVLGGWDPSQILSGQLDEIRMWNRVRTAAEIKDNYRLKVGPTTANLMMYYNFDDASATDTWFVDAVDATNAAKRMYVGDHSDPLKTPSTSAPPSQPVPAYVISNAPVCATQGDARIRSLPGAAQQVMHRRCCVGYTLWFVLCGCYWGSGCQGL